jgi:hypothetical protein
LKRSNSLLKPIKNGSLKRSIANCVTILFPFQANNLI